MPGSVTELVDLLDLEEIEVGLFRGRQPKTALQRVFGGQVLAQGLVAASRTVPGDRRLHSMHGYFIRPGRTDLPIVFDVENIRDGRSFSARRAVARQGGSVIFFASSSFHTPEEGVEHAGRGPHRRAGPGGLPDAERGAVAGLRPAGLAVGAGVGCAGGPLHRRLATTERAL